MIPKTMNDEIDIITLSSKTYKLNLEDEIINNYIDYIESVKQSIYKILNTNRYDYLIYSFDYGFELTDLIGKDINLVITELKNRIVDALIQDDRIKSITNFKFNKSDKESLVVTFIVNTVFGNLEITKELEV